MPERPLLILPQLGPPLRRIPKKFGFGEHIRLPSRDDQARRFSSKFESMLDTFVAETPDGIGAENILVLETGGRIEDFKKAVDKVNGLEWLAEIDIDEIESDDSFFEKPKIGARFFKDRISAINDEGSKAIQHSFIEHNLIDKYHYPIGDLSPSEIASAVPAIYEEHLDAIVDVISKEKRKPIAGRMYLSLSNRQALEQVKWLFEATQRGERPPQLTAPWENLFMHLSDVRYWDVEDRIRDTGVLQYWEEELKIKKGTSSTISFEIEFSYSNDEASRRIRQQTIEQMVVEEGGTVVAACHIKEIRFHALKVEMPVNCIEKVVSKDFGALFRSGSVYLFHPAARCCADQFEEGDLDEIGEIAPPANSEATPVIALLDGLPFVHHTLLSDYLIIDDPDSFADAYEPHEHRHGTAMASLICHGELDGVGIPLQRKIYVRPIMKPEEHGSGRIERIPSNLFFEDLLERAVRRMFESEGDEPPSASSIKIINLSVADPERLFHHTLSPTARLLDWLSFKYSVLFCVSAGNIKDDISLGIDIETFRTLDDSAKISTTLTAINTNKRNRRLFSPAESINAVTVGAVHDDMSPHSSMGYRVDILPDTKLPSPISTLGYGFRSSIKPDILLPGGRQLYEHIDSGVYSISQHKEPPGQKVAASAVNRGERNRTLYSRGTSNATALATRNASFIYDVLEALFSELTEVVPTRNIAPLLKTLLVHGASWGEAAEIISNHLDLTGHSKKKELTRFLGYGCPDIQKVLECTATRATALGFGTLERDQRHEYKFPLPPSLSGMNAWRRLTITLAWFSPTSADNRKYRRAALAFVPTGLDNQVGGKRSEASGHQVKGGTIQHEVIEGKKVAVFLDGDCLLIPVECREDAGRLDVAIPYGIAVTLEVKEEVDIPVYEEVKSGIEVTVREHIASRIQ